MPTDTTHKNPGTQGRSGGPYMPRVHLCGPPNIHARTRGTPGLPSHEDKEFLSVPACWLDYTPMHGNRNNGQSMYIRTES